MGNIRKILLAVRKFSPEGQDIVMQTLQAHKNFLKSEEYAFADLPRLLSGNGLKEIEGHLKNPNNSVRDIILSLLKTKRHRFSASENIYRAAQETALSTIKSSQLSALQDGFLSKKNQFVDILRNFKDSGDLIQKAENITKPEELRQILYDFVQKQNNTLLTMQNNGASIDEIMQKSFEIQSVYFELLKSCAKKSDNMTVKRIENIIENRYKIKYVCLDNLEDARNMLKAVQTVSRHGIPMPERILVTSLAEQPCNMIFPDGTRNILIKSKSSLEDFNKLFYETVDKLSGRKYPLSRIKEDNLKLRSTINSAHDHTHELIHSEVKKPIDNYVLLDTKNNRDLATAYKASDYIAQSAFKKEEARTELKVKSFYDRLKPKEEELLNRIDFPQC